jgi:hypothetical protein
MQLIWQNSTLKSNALLKSEKYKMHDMVIDTCESDSMKIIASSGAGETKQEVAFSNTVELGSGKVSELSLASFTNIKESRGEIICHI